MGSSRSQLYYPHAIDVTESGTMFIMDTYNYRVLKWQAGEPMGFVVAGGYGSGGGFNQFGYSYAIFVDQQQDIYISDYTNNRIMKWSSSNTTTGSLVIFFILFLLIQYI